MMYTYGTCPRCSTDISPERLKAGGIVICDNCGFVLSNSEDTYRMQGNENFLKWMLGMTLVFIVIFTHVTMWDNYSLEVIPIYMKQLVGSTSSKDLERLVEICMDRKRFECVEHSYTRLGDRDVKHLLKLGQFQMDRGNYIGASNTYHAYFTKGGKSLEASYLFARALQKSGRTDEAAKYYDHVLTSRADSLLQSAAVQQYARMLVSEQKPDKARLAVERVRTKSKMAAYLMDDEISRLQGTPSAGRGIASVKGP